MLRAAVKEKFGFSTGTAPYGPVIEAYSQPAGGGSAEAGKRNISEATAMTKAHNAVLPASNKAFFIEFAHSEMIGES
jgi:hypothetical protein